MSHTQQPLPLPQQQDVSVATLPAMVTLPIGEWEKVISFIGVNRWIDVNPLIVAIHRQINDALAAQTSTAREPERAAPAD